MPELAKPSICAETAALQSSNAGGKSRRYPKAATITPAEAD